MDLYTLTTGFQHKDIVEGFQEMVWTEKYSAYGDFKLTAPDTLANRALLQEGVMVSIPDSRDVMIIETPNYEDGLIKITGMSLVGFLQHRMLRDKYSTAAGQSKYWSLTGAPGNIAGQIVQQMCMAGGIMAGASVLADGSNEVIPHLVLGSLASGTSQTIAVEYGNVYDGVKTVCEMYGLGFDLYPANITDVSYDLVFTTWAGLDRTSTQSTNSVVIFEPALDSLAETKELRSIAGYKNVAYAFAPNYVSANRIIGSAFADSNAINATGFARRTLMVEADDINTGASDAAVIALLNQRAVDALANNNYTKIVDGEVVPQNAFTYGLDYYLGDIIELRGADGNAQKARITEYIRSVDSNGSKAYPTLSVVG